MRTRSPGFLHGGCRKNISNGLRFWICGISVGALLLFGGNTYGSVVRTVTQNGDSGLGSLRQTVSSSFAGDEVNFAVTGDITLTTPLLLTHDITIRGPGARELRITGNRIEITAGNIVMSSLTVGGTGTRGILLTAGRLTMNDCAVSGNTAGGVEAKGGTTLTMTRCTISGNSEAGGSGGGGLRNTGTATLTNCTIAGNSTTRIMVGPSIYAGGYGGGVLNVTPGTLSLTNCTVTLNSGDYSGGGINSVTGGGAYVQIVNSIVSGNSAPAGSGPDCSGTFLSSGYNVIGIGDGSSGFTDNINHDSVGTLGAPRNPFLGSLKDNGGDTDTCAIPSAISTAVNRASVFIAPPRDQRGYVRPNGPDSGAFEYNGTQPVTLANISSRALVMTGDNVLIGGFIVTGATKKKVMIRAIGPSLNLGGFYDPVLELYSGDQLIASNNNWGTAPNAAEIQATGLAPTDYRESAILTSLDPGHLYTAIVRGFNGETGIGLVEVYDLDRTVGSRLANISTRAFVHTGDFVLIGGFIVLGPESMPVIIRGIGTSLTLASRMVDPTIELHNGNGAIIAMNDNWRFAQEAEIIATTLAPTEDAESAIVTTLVPGNYTVIVRGAKNPIGIAVVEVYGLL